MDAAAKVVLGARPLLERVGARGTVRLINATLRDTHASRTVRLSTGVRLHVDLDDRVQRSMAFRLYERRELRLMASMLASGDTMIDLGAHVGYFALHAAKAVGPAGRVLALEPAPANFERLQRNIDLGPAPQVTAIQAAVGERSGVAAFQLVDEPGESGWGSLMLAPGEHTREISVDVLSVDDLVARHDVEQVTFIKMDVQGSELDALRGATQTLQRWAPNVLCEVVEAWWGPSQTTTTADLFAFMRDAGYRAFGLPFRGAPEPTTGVSQRFLNVLFTKSDTFPGRY